MTQHDSPMVSFDLKKDHAITFNDLDGKQIGRIDFNGPSMIFEGNLDPSAKIFFNLIALFFDQRLKEERSAGRKEAFKESQP